MVPGPSSPRELRREDLALPGARVPQTSQVRRVDAAHGSQGWV